MGQKPKFNFTPKTHLEINKKVQFVDFVRGSKISGSGFPYYVGKGALLERNLINAMINHHVSKYTYQGNFTLSTNESSSDDYNRSASKISR